jgi:hypothetical protein
MNDTQGQEPQPMRYEFSPIATGISSATLQPPRKIRRIVITEIDHGYMVEVGCQHMAIESRSKLITLLSTYILDPAGTEKLFLEGKLLNP